MTTLREAAQQALEALQAYGSHAPNCEHLVLLTSLPPRRKPCSCGLGANITALRAALAEPQHKPQPLTDEEIWRTYKNLWMFHPAEEPRLAGDVLKFARAIERAHGIKE